MKPTIPIQTHLLTALFLLGAACISGCNPATATPSSDSPLSVPAKNTIFKRGINISHWLAQNRNDRPYGAAWFSSEDVNWIAEQGFDHIRIPVDARLWMNADGSLNASKLTPFDQACKWAQTNKLGVILDMHTVPGANFSSKGRDNSLFINKELQQKAARFWGEVAAHYAAAGSWLRFELINEPVAENNEQLNPVQALLLAAIRETNPTRKVHITSNMWSKFRTVPDVRLPKDPNVVLTVHFYDPPPFTHQLADWTEYKALKEPFEFPGVVPDLTPILSPGHSRLALSGKFINAENMIDPEFKELADWKAQHAPDLEIHIGEFGAYEKAPEESIRRYYAAVVSAAERHGFGWAAWDYQGGFAVRALDGSATKAMQGIMDGITSASEK